MRLLIYGGTFNPPHLGHIDALSCAAASLSADRCIVVPAGIPPHKALAEGSPTAEERLRLCELAFPDADVTPMELRREGKSYTVDTLREISRGNPGAELYFLVGTDMLLYMEQWYEFRALFSLCTLAALPRADGDMAEIERYAAYLRETYGARIEIIAKTPLPMDSTALRAALPQRGGTERLCDAVYSEIIRCGERRTLTSNPRAYRMCAAARRRRRGWRCAGAKTRRMPPRRVFCTTLPKGCRTTSSCVWRKNMVLC